MESHISLDSGPSQTSTEATRKPKVIGIYGIGGSGKSHLLSELKRLPKKSEFVFYDGSDMIRSVVPGGLDVFEGLDDAKKNDYRRLATKKIRDEAAASDRTAVVAGHYMFWNAKEGEHPTVVSTDADWDVYTHIIYLSMPADIVAQRRQNDTQRQRPEASEAHLAQWMAAERDGLEKACLEHGILFCPLYTVSAIKVINLVDRLVLDFHAHDEEHNLAVAQCYLDAQIRYVRWRIAGAKHAERTAKWHMAVVLDGDRTLVAQDTGKLFWSEINRQDPFKTLFGSIGYSYTAFRQATLLYESEASRFGSMTEFDHVCDRVVKQTRVYPEMEHLMVEAAATPEHQPDNGVLVIVLTCGMAQIWRKIVAPLGGHIIVVGGGLVSDGFVVTPAVKAALVQHLQSTLGVKVWAFGDSPLDLPMLQQADEAVVIVGDAQTRSRTMDAKLERLVKPWGDLQAYQARIPPTASPRLDTWRLPIIDLTDGVTVAAILGAGTGRGVLHVVHASDRPAARLLAAPTRDASVAGPALCDAHRRIGRYLALELVAPLVGLESVTIPHVQGRAIQGHVVRGNDAARTTIVALMRGGEPMALGIYDIVPGAAFVHARNPEDLTAAGHVAGRQTVLLVDSVVNNGKTLVEFVQRIRSLDAHVRIIFVAGVVQAGAMADDGYVAQHIGRDSNFSLVALRMSQNKYTGLGTTDTGNRLFNTTHLE